MKKYTPKTLIKYITKEFSLCLLIFFSIFISLILLTTYVEELIYFKEKNLGKNFYLSVFILSLIKSPYLIIDFLPFIFLFSGVFFFVRFLKKNEVLPINLSGFSNNFLILIPSIYALIFGIIIILIADPASSKLLNIYEKKKQEYAKNNNLIIINNTGIWLKENLENHKYFIRADKIQNNNFSLLENITIYKIHENGIFVERLDAKTAVILNKKWNLKKGKITQKNTFKKFEDYNYSSLIDLNKLKNYFSNAKTISLWNVKKELKILKSRGYYPQNIIINLNKNLSLPFVLFVMINISAIFTINLSYRLNNFFYAFLSILTGIGIYFLSDTSIAFGKTGRIPLALSVWLPVILMFLISIFNFMNNDEKA